MRRLFGPIAALSILAATTRTEAEEGPESVAVLYEAPSTCPSAEAFFSELAARTTRVRAAQPNERARVMHVVIVQRGEAHAGRLWIDDTRTSTARAVSGKTCREVVGALALIGALAVDPQASSHTSVAKPQSEREEAASDRTTEGSSERSKDGGTAAKTRAVKGTSTPTARGGTEAHSESAPGAGGLAARFETGAQIELAFPSGAVPSARVFFDVTLGPHEGVLAPSLRLAGARSLEIDRDAAAGRATFRWTTGGLDLCPLRFGVAPALVVRPCVGTDFGLLEAAGTDIPHTTERSRPWATVSAQGRLTWKLRPWLEFELEGGVTAPFFRESFFFAPGLAVYQAPLAWFFSRFGLGIRFP